MPSGAIITTLGLAKLASATPLNQLNISTLAVGDGNGGYPTLDPSMTALANEVWRGTPSPPIRDPNSPNVLIFEAVIPPSVGGFTVREQAIFDDAGDMIAIGQTSVVEKPLPNAATGVMLTVRLHIQLDSAEQVDLFFQDDPTISAINVKDESGGSVQDFIDETERFIDAQYITVADLQGLDLTNIDAVFVSMYHNIGDTSGGGLFVKATGRHDGGTFIDPARPFPTDWNDQTQLEAWFADSEVDVVGFKRVYDGPVNVKWFGTKGDSGTDDYQSIFAALRISVIEKNSCYVPKGDYLIGTTIDLNDLPSNSEMVVLYGEDCSTNRGQAISRLIGAGGLSVMFSQAFDATLATQRRLTVKNFSITSQEPFDNLNLRASLQAFNIYCSPYSTYENLSFIGITSGIHVRAAWFCKFKNINSSRVDKTLFIDGDDGAGSYGWADHCEISHFAGGSYAKTGGWGLRIRGSKATKITFLDGESGYQGPLLVLEGTHGVSVDTIYTEGYQTAQPIILKPIEGSNLQKLSQWCLNTKLTNVHSLSTGSDSGALSVFLIAKGTKNVIIENAKHFRGDAAGREKNVGPLISFTGGGFTNPNGALYIGNISLTNCALSDRETSLTNSDPYSQMFCINGNIVQKNSNRIYYGLVLNERERYVNTVLSTDQFVLTKGTLAQPLTITADTTAGSRIITVNNTTNLVVGTYVNVGAQTGLLVTSIDGLAVWLGGEISTTATGVPVTYTVPTYL